MSRKVDRTCRMCSYYFPITEEQSRSMEAQVEYSKWPVKVVHEILLAMRRALMKCGVCGWRGILVAGSDDRGCDLWYRDE